MFYRLLGKLFFYFFVMPSINRAWRFARPFIVRSLTKLIEEITKEEIENASPNLRNMPRPPYVPQR